MAGIFFEIRGLEPILARLGKLDNLMQELAQPTRETLQLLKARLQEYPPPPAGSTYVRTDTLKNGWQELLILAGDTLGRVENNTWYGSYVMGEGQQAAVHAGRWQTDEGVKNEKEREVVAIYEAYIRQLVERI